MMPGALDRMNELNRLDRERLSRESLTHAFDLNRRWPLSSYQRYGLRQVENSALCVIWDHENNAVCSDPMPLLDLEVKLKGEL